MKRTYQNHLPSSPTSPKKETYRLFTEKDVEIDILVQGFLDSRRGLSPKTIIYYRDRLAVFKGYLSTVGITHIEEVVPATIRDFMAYLEERGNNPGCIHANYRAVKAMMFWWEKETEYEYKPPIKRVPAPKIKVKPLPGITSEEIQKLIDCCRGDNQKRDRCMLQTLFDTGVRAHELVALNIEDVDFGSGAVKVRHGKGDKERTVFLGVKSRRMLRAYLKERHDLKPFDPLFTIDEGTRITYSTIREMIRRRSVDAKLDGTPYPHDFRRAFALTLWRNGVDIVTISRLMGHSALEVLKRYLDQGDEDLARAHAQASPVDTKLR